MVPFLDSVELVRNSGLPESALIDVGHEHRLANPYSLKAMVDVVETVHQEMSKTAKKKAAKVATKKVAKKKVAKKKTAKVKKPTKRAKADKK